MMTVSPANGRIPGGLIGLALQAVLGLVVWAIAAALLWAVWIKGADDEMAKSGGDGSGG